MASNNQRTFINFKILILCLIDSRLMWEWLKSRDGRLISRRNDFRSYREGSGSERAEREPASSRTLIKILNKIELNNKKPEKSEKPVFPKRSSRIPRRVSEREREQHIRRTHHQYCVKIKTLFFLSPSHSPYSFGLFSHSLPDCEFVWWIYHPNLICVSDCSFSSLSLACLIAVCCSVCSHIRIMVKCLYSFSFAT